MKQNTLKQFSCFITVLVLFIYNTLNAQPVSWTINSVGLPTSLASYNANIVRYSKGYIYVAGTVYDATGNFVIRLSKYNGNGVLLASTTLNHTPGVVFGDSPVELRTDTAGNLYLFAGYYFNTTWLTDAVLIKFNSALTEQWRSYIYGSAGFNDKPMALYTDVSGNSYTATIISSTSSTVSGLAIVIRKFTASGSVTVNFNIIDDATNSIVTVKDIKADASGTIYICGSKHSVANGNRFFVAKYNNTGALTWTKFYDRYSAKNDVANSLDLDNSGNVYVTGSGQNSADGYDCIIRKLSAAGATVWNKIYKQTGAINDYGIKLMLDGNNNVYVASNDDDDSPFYGICTVLKYTSGGTVVWKKTITTDHINNMNVSSAGTAFIAGSYYPYSTAVKISTAGALDWNDMYTPSTVYGPSFANNFGIALKANTEDAVFCGSINYYNSSFNQEYGWYIRKYHPAGPKFENSIIDLGNTVLQCYPNPATDKITITCNKTINDLYVYNLTGKLVSQKNNLNDLEIEMATTQLNVGVYFVRIATGSEIKTLRFVKQ